MGKHPSKKDKYPWMAHLELHGNFRCGAALINSRWILSAAHCVVSCYGGGDNLHVPVSYVILGDFTLHAYERGEIKMAISDIIKHPEYDCRITKFEHDIALLKLDKDFDFKTRSHRHIRPICLPEDDSQTYEGWDATTTGWGMYGLKEEEKLSSVLQEITGKVQPNSFSACTRLHINRLCVIWPGGQKTCPGDSGGPLISKPAGHDGATAGQNYELIGVDSYGYGKCENTGFSGVTGFARVTEHLNWIQKTISTTEFTSCQRK